MKEDSMNDINIPNITNDVDIKNKINEDKVQAAGHNTDKKYNYFSPKLNVIFYGNSTKYIISIRYKLNKIWHFYFNESGQIT